MAVEAGSVSAGDVLGSGSGLGWCDLAETIYLTVITRLGRSEGDGHHRGMIRSVACQSHGISRWRGGFEGGSVAGCWLLARSQYYPGWIVVF